MAMGTRTFTVNVKGVEEYLPGKGIHRFTAKSAVYLYAMPDGVFDIHYVDAEGKEIPPEKALASQIKAKPAAGSK